jgi:hypothetical protein
MILGTTVKTLARLVPGYRLVAPGIARTTLSVCVCKNCAHCMVTRSAEHNVCKRVVGKLEEDGYAIVAWNGSCDRAEFREDGDTNLELKG